MVELSAFSLKFKFETFRVMSELGLHCVLELGLHCVLELGLQCVYAGV